KPELAPAGEKAMAIEREMIPVCPIQFLSAQEAFEGSQAFGFEVERKSPKLDVVPGQPEGKIARRQRPANIWRYRGRVRSRPWCGKGLEGERISHSRAKLV